jgi:Smg protein
MFEVLAFVYENYWGGDACPQSEHLERKLSAVGFEAAEIADALTWLGGLNLVAQGAQISTGAPKGGQGDPGIALHAGSAHSMRVYSSAEQDQLGSECLGFISFLESSNVLSASLREVVLDRAMAASSGPLSLEDLKIIVLMVYWRFGQEPDALVLDELCDDSRSRVPH